MNTVEVRQGNVYLTINVEDVDRYMAKGFDVVDEAGNVIKKSVPNDINVLRQAYEQHTAEIAKLKEENESLKAQLKAKPKAAPGAPSAAEVKEVKASTTKKTSSPNKK